ncbi:MAG: hypothetical protein IJ551_03425 [Prevotella sp.]|nr:hypothetical protein [Prevotella sp.]
MKSIFCLPLLTILLLSACYSGQRREMLALLDEADSLNRAYAPLPSDSVLRQAADFFDRHGSANDQVRAHYLLGCAYRDQGQAPEALQAYQDALDRADTLSSDCDFQRLMAVYGQMATLYHLQNLPHDELKCYHLYKQLAIRENDTLKYIHSCEVASKSYDLLGDTVKMLATLEEARQLYEQAGYHEWAVQTLAPSIYVEICRGNLATARLLMQQYESESGLFDSSGSIVTGCETYYYFKGLLYLCCDSLDQAETYMRRLQLAGERVNAYRGLVKIYHRRRQIDSLYKYSLLFEAANDSVALSRQTSVIHQASTLYDYQSHKIKAERAVAQKKIAEVTTALILILAVVALLLLWLFYHRYINRKKEAYRDLLYELNDARRSLQKIEKEYALLQQNQDSLAEKKQMEILHLKNEIAKHEQRWSALSYESKRAAMQENRLVTRLRKYARGNNRVLPPNAADWLELLDSFREGLPAVFAVLHEKGSELSLREQQVLMLHILKFTTSEMAVLLELSAQSVSNLKANINQKMYGKKTASQLDANLKMSIREIV